MAIIFITTLCPFAVYHICHPSIVTIVVIVFIYDFLVYKLLRNSGDALHKVSSVSMN